MDPLMRQAIEQHRHHWPETYDALLMPFSLTLYRSHGVIHGRACKIMEKYGLSPAEFDVLASLRRLPPPHELTPSQLQASLLITSGGLTKILHQLEKRGLIARLTVKEDRRVKPVRLAEAGMPVIEQAMLEIIAQVGGWVTATLSQEELAQVTAILGKLAQTE